MLLLVWESDESMTAGVVMYLWSYTYHNVRYITLARCGRNR